VGRGCRFTPLGLAEEGLQAFCGYVRGLIAARAKEDLRELDTSAQPDFVSALTNVLQDIGTAVETNGALLAASFPDDALLRACQVRELSQLSSCGPPAGMFDRTVMLPALSCALVLTPVSGRFMPMVCICFS
jgi:hypothetical protein